MTLSSKLSNIHKTILKKFVYVSDKKKHGVDEYWEIPDVGSFKITGDCEEFALACRELCLKESLRPRLIICKIKATNEHHLVLELGGYILDNRMSSLRTIRQLKREYEWIAASGFELDDMWAPIEGVE